MSEFVDRVAALVEEFRLAEGLPPNPHIARSYAIGIEQMVLEPTVLATELRHTKARVEELEAAHVESERQLREWQDRTAAAEAKVNEYREALAKLANTAEAFQAIPSNPFRAASLANVIDAARVLLGESGDTE